jgi:predicted permease
VLSVFSRITRPGIRRWFRLPTARGNAVESEVDEEIRIHLALLTEELMRKGVLSEAEARREAERRFGPIEERRADLHRLAERRRRSHDRAMWWSGIRHDLRVAMRSARRNAVLTVVSTLVLGLGIGITTAVFSLFNSVIIRPLPYRDPSRLVVIWQTARAGSGEFSSGVFDNARDAAEWTSRSRSFDALGELTWANGSQVYWPDHGPPRDVLAIPTSDNFFEMLGVSAEQGRTFSRDDESNGCTVVLSHAFWRSTFGSDRAAIGRRITLGDALCSVVGVMPASFEFYPRQTELWLLMNPAADTVLARHPDRYLVGVFGRLRHGVSSDQAERELRAIQTSGSDQTPFRRAFTPTVFDLQHEFTWLAGRNLRTTLVIMLGAVSIVLLVVCINISNLSLGRAASREREFAVRIAIGSGRWRLSRQLLTEAALLAGLGSIVGLVIALGGMSYIDSGRAIELPPGATVHLDGTALIATIAMAVFATIVVGLVPALHATRTNTSRALTSSSRSASGDRRSGRVANALVVSQVSLSVMLLVAAGLLFESLTRLGNAPLGYTPENVLTMRVNIATRDTMEAKRVFTDALERVHAIPGVAGAAWTSVVPVEGRGSVESIVVEGRAPSARDSIPDVGEQTVSESYFRLMSIPLLAGRGLTGADVETAPPVAIVNRAFVDRYVGDAGAIGRRIKFGGASESWLTIVGVVGNERRATVSQEMGWSTPPMVFRPMRQVKSSRTMLLVVRWALGSTTIADAAERAILSVSRGAIITDVATMHELLDRFLASPRTRAESVAALALLAFLLAVIGLYGMLSQLVVYRTREIGIRVALGARPEQVVASVVRRGVVLAVVGVLAGCVLAVPATKGMSALLYGVTTFDPATLVTVGIVMLATAVIASVIPARRAAAVDPVIALRAE